MEEFIPWIIFYVLSAVGAWVSTRLYYKIILKGQHKPKVLDIIAVIVPVLNTSTVIAFCLLFILELYLREGSDIAVKFFKLKDAREHIGRDSDTK